MQFILEVAQFGERLTELHASGSTSIPDLPFLYL